MTRAQLQRLRDQVHALQRAAHESPVGEAATLLAELQRSLARRRVDGAAPPVLRASRKTATPSAPARQGRLRAVAERAPLLVRAMGRGGNCRWANQSWSTFTGRAAERTLGDGWLQDVHADDRARCAFGDVTANEPQDFLEQEYRLHRATGGYAWIHEHRVPHLTSRGAVAGYLATAIDVTPRKCAERHQDLIYAAERALLQGASVDEDVTAILALLCRSLEWDVGELWSWTAALGEPSRLRRWSSLEPEHPEHLESDGHADDTAASDGNDEPLWVADIAVDERFAASPEVQDRDLHGMLRLPVPLLLPGRASLRLYSHGVRPRDDAMIAVAACVAARLGHALERRPTTAPPQRSTYPRGSMSVTERKVAEDAVAHYRSRVQSLMGELLLAEERERKLLAMDLHDGLSQTIALAQIKLSALRATQESALDTTLDTTLGEVQELMEHADRAARSIGFELSPLVLHDLGLEAALQWLTENIRERYGVAVRLRHAGAVTPADETMRVIVFRAIRELVINAAKHAAVRSVSVHLECRRGHLYATVTDDGVGMDPGAALSEGFGLLSIRERMAHIGGKMSIDSMRGKGTTVRLSAPLAPVKPKSTTMELR